MLTRRCAVVGHPVSHSLSPALHRAGYARLGLDWTYDTVDVEPGGLPELVSGLDASWRGLSVTMPHKSAAARLGEPDQVVTQLGIANTIVLGDHPTVHNTDVDGFTWALGRRGVRNLDSALILGAGATAQSVLLGASRLGARKVFLAVRNVQRARGAARLATSLGLGCEVVQLTDPLPKSDVVVSTIPAASVPAQDAAGAAPVVFDVIYDPWPTPLANAARGVGAELISGLDLLVGQALRQFELFTGAAVAPEVLETAGRLELARRSPQLEG